ncbi:MAG: MarR family transcriptional regulator [Acidobacteria bacterium]|nr:MarR family transcriptional regulator [Acidobacteriota bacterium]
MSKRTADISGTRVWLMLMKAHRTLARHAARSITSLEMCFSDFAILEALLHKGPLPVTEVGRKIELTSGSITTAVDRLEARGLVERGADPADRRSRIVHLTAEGEKQISRVFAEHKTSMDHAAAHLSAAERTTLIALLKKLGVTAQRQLTAGETSS